MRAARCSLHLPRPYRASLKWVPGMNASWSRRPDQVLPDRSNMRGQVGAALAGQVSSRFGKACCYMLALNDMLSCCHASRRCTSSPPGLELWRCRGSAELIDALDTVLDKNSAIYSFRREPNAASHNLALALYAECMKLWQEGGGPQKRLNLLDKAPWNSLTSLVRTMDSTGEAAVSP